MNTRKSALAVVITLALGAPLSALAGGFWQITHDEAGSTIVTPELGAPRIVIAAKDVKPLRAGELSADRQYVFLGGEGGWQLRPMEYAYEGGSLAHVDDPVGHMHRTADMTPLTEAERNALRRSGGA